MPEIRSPLASVLDIGRFGATFANGPGVTLSATPVLYLAQIAGWDDFEEALLPVLKDMGFADAGDTRASRKAGELNLFRTAPDRILIASSGTIEVANDEIDRAGLAYLDLTQSRCRMIIEGEDAEYVMARLAPIDFRLTALPVENFVQTGIHHVNVLIHRTAKQRFEVLVPVTWARSIWEMICLGAEPFGYNVEQAP